MSVQKDTPMIYAASVNPPRRAKRARTGSQAGRPDPSPVVAVASSTPTPTSSQPRRAAARPPILPRQPTTERDYAVRASPDSDSDSGGEDDYDPGRDAVSAPKRRGRKPGTMSRSARESLRKLNHSRIEKARRTKINETLSTLSMLVNERGQVLAAEQAEVSSHVEPIEEPAKKGKGKTEEKEFKLDVLVKTVEYMQDLVERVKALEGKMCAQCRVRMDVRAEATTAAAAAVPPSPKRKRPEAENMEDIREHGARRPRQSRSQEEDDMYVGDDEHGLGAAEEEQPSPMPFVAPAATSTRPTASSRLPSIASWLPHPYIDPSSLMASSTRRLSPNAAAALVRSPTNAQLPSPPPSGRFRPAITLANMPALALPAPAHPLAPLVLPGPSQKKRGPGGSGGNNNPQRKSVSASPTVSPTWTPEDETAASMLLQMSVKPRSSSISSASGGSSSSSSARHALPRAVPPMTPREEAPNPQDRAFASRSFEVVTPGSLLGMTD